jgi:HD-GYP domain-containing protein (c-di-GMP phosphodiesterase class II)
VSTITVQTQALTPTRVNIPTVGSVEAAWDVLDRFGHALQPYDRPAEQIRLLLESVRQSLGADAVYWYSGRSGDAPDYVGQPRLPAEWRRDFLCREMARIPDNQGQFVRNFVDADAKPSAHLPCSAAFVRMRASRGSWLVALSFHPQRTFGPLDLKVMRLARRLLLNHRQHRQLRDKLKDSLFGLVRCLIGAIDAKDPFAWGHSDRVGRVAVRLGKQLRLPAGTLSDLYLAGLLHDIGNVGIREDVLLKPARLTDEETAHMREHTLIGDRLVHNISQLGHLRPGVRNHHERWDGRGYPDGLRGEDIPLMARIVAVADACDAMMAVRPYRSALPPARIEAEMRKGAGQQWDPKIVDCFFASRHEVYSICQRGVGDAVLLGVD